MSNPLNLPEEDEAWTALLRSLSSSPQEPEPFFFSRLQARLAAQSPLPTFPVWFRRSAYALSTTALVLAMNADTALAYVH